MRTGATWRAASPHLAPLCVYPSNQISPSATPELAKAAAVSLNERSDRGTGFGMAWKAACWARLLDGEHANRCLANLVALQTCPNLFSKCFKAPQVRTVRWARPPRSPRCSCSRKPARSTCCPRCRVLGAKASSLGWPGTRRLWSRRGLGPRPIDFGNRPLCAGRAVPRSRNCAFTVKQGPRNVELLHASDNSATFSTVTFSTATFSTVPGGTYSIIAQAK